MIQLENKARAIYKLINPNAFYDDEFTCIQSGIVYRKKSEISQYVSLYPNPSTGALFISYSVLANATLEITDELGRTLVLKELDYSSSSATLDISKFLNGFYFYKIHDESKILFNGKIVLAK